jgi:hypothetical protein
MITIKLPNGDSIDFPDSMSKDEINAAVKKHLAQQNPAPIPSEGDTPAVPEPAAPQGLLDRVRGAASNIPNPMIKNVLGAALDPVGTAKDTAENAAAGSVGALRTLTLGNLDNIFAGIDMLKPGNTASYSENRDAELARMKALEADNPFATAIGSVGGAVLGPNIAAKTGLVKAAVEKVPALGNALISKIGSILVPTTVGGAAGGITAYGEDNEAFLNAILGAAGGAGGALAGKVLSRNTDTSKLEALNYLKDKVELTGQSPNTLAARVGGADGANLADMNPALANAVGGAAFGSHKAARNAADMLNYRMSMLPTKLKGEIDDAFGGNPISTGLLEARANQYKSDYLSPEYTAAIKANDEVVDAESIVGDLESIFLDEKSGNPLGGTLGSMFRKLRGNIRSTAVDVRPGPQIINDAGELVDGPDIRNLSVERLMEIRQALDRSLDPPTLGAAPPVYPSATLAEKNKLKAARALIDDYIKDIAPELKPFDAKFEMVSKAVQAYKLADDLAKPGADVSLVESALDRLDTEMYKFWQEGMRSNLYEAVAAKSENALLNQLATNDNLYAIYEKGVGSQTLARVMKSLELDKTAKTTAKAVSAGVEARAAREDTGTVIDKLRNLFVAASYPVPGGAGTTATAQAVSKILAPRLSDDAAASVVNTLLDPQAGKLFLQEFEAAGPKLRAKLVERMLGQSMSGSTAATLFEKLTNGPSRPQQQPR